MSECMHSNDDCLFANSNQYYEQYCIQNYNSIVGNHLGKLLCDIRHNKRIRKNNRGRSSKKFVKFFLSNEKWKEVEVKNAKEYEEFLNQLKRITKFYAIIDESKNSIIVNVVFDNKDIDPKKLYFEAISKEDFEKFYKIKK